MPGIWLVNGARTTHQFPKHSHDFFVIGAFTQGCQMSHYGLRDYETSAGDVVWLPPGEVHDGRPIGSRSDPQARSYAMAYVDIRAMRTLLDDYDPEQASSEKQLAKKVVFGRRSGVQNAVFRFLNALLCGQAGNELVSLTFGQLAELIGRTAQHGKLPDKAYAIKHRLDEGNTSISGIAHELGISRFALLRCFSQATGFTPSAYLRQRRVDQAVSMLGTRATLTRIAHEAGFADQSHMTRDFNAFFGVSPSQYRAVIN